MDYARTIYGQIYSKLEKLIPNLADLKPGVAGKSESKPYMDLHLDVLAAEDHGALRIALHHAYIQNGDLVADPDMEIRIYRDRHLAEALTFQDSFGYREVYPRPGYVNIKAKKELNTFLNKWLKNCLDQNHSLVTKTEEELEAARRAPPAPVSGPTRTMDPEM